MEHRHIGDAFNMRHPLTGGGMTFALSDGVILRNLLHQPMESTINKLTGALYKVFCASSDPARKEMRQAGFDFVSLRGMCSSVPISLLSGLNARLLVLVCHFSMVAIYGVGRMCFPFPSLVRMWIGVRLISAASEIIFPIMKDEGLRQTFFPSIVPVN